MDFRKERERMWLLAISVNNLEIWATLARQSFNIKGLIVQIYNT
jgi:hypothetical protein